MQRLPTHSLALIVVGTFALPLAAQSKPATLHLTESVRIDATKENLADISWAAVSAKGIVAVEQRADTKILFFDGMTGKRLGEFGRAGAGPGEFRQMATIGWVGDTLWVNDLSLNRTTYIGPAFKLLRDVASKPTVVTNRGDTVAMSIFSNAFPTAVYADGSYLATSWRIRKTARPTWYKIADDKPPILIATPAGNFVRLIGYEPDHSHCTVWYNNGATNLNIPLCAGSLISFSPDGNTIVAVEQQNPNSATANPRVITITSHGDTLYSRELSVPAIPITKHFADSALNQRMNPPGITLPPGAKETYGGMTLPHWFAAVQSVKAGRDGTVWLQIQGTAAATTSEYLVLDAKGLTVGTATLPKSARVSAVSRNAVWVISIDGDGLQSLLKYRVM